MNELNYEVERLYVFIKVVLFLIGDNVIILNYKDIIDQLDYEGELGIVIGKFGEKILKVLVLDYVYGYIIINDIIDRKV